MKKYLCVLDDDDLTLGKLYPVYKEEADRLDLIVDDIDEIWWSHGASGEANKHFMQVETFTKDGREWICHTGEECPVPSDWRVNLILNDGTITRFDRIADSLIWDLDDGFCSKIVAYRIISTGQDLSDDHNCTAPVDHQEMTHSDYQKLYSFGDFSEEIINHGAFTRPVERIPLFSERTNIGMKERDNREPSNKELLFAMIREAEVLDECKPEQPKTFPSRALADFGAPLMLGGKFGGHHD